jgi:GcrA cell cycle regulator
MPVALSPWTEERIVDLKLYAEQGYSCSQIAGLLGNATRNSVVGKLHRLGISTVNQPGGGSRKKNPTPRRSVAKSRVFATRWGASDDHVKPPLDLSRLRAADLIPLHVSLVQLGASSCRFPYGDGPFTFCGHDTLGQGSYCDQHHWLVYKAPETRQPRPDTAAMNRQKYPTAAVLAALEATEEAA